MQRHIGHLDGVIGRGLVVAVLGIVVQKLVPFVDALGALNARRVALPPIGCDSATGCRAEDIRGAAQSQHLGWIHVH